MLTRNRGGRSYTKSLRGALSAPLILALGCATVGTGRHVLIRATCDSTRADSACSFAQTQVPLFVLDATATPDERTLAWKARDPLLEVHGGQRKRDSYSGGAFRRSPHSSGHCHAVITGRQLTTTVS